MKKLWFMLVIMCMVSFTVSAAVIVIDDDGDRDGVAGPNVTSVNMSSHDNGGWGSGTQYFNTTNAYNGDGDNFNGGAPGAGASVTYTFDSGIGVLPGVGYNVYVTWPQPGQGNLGPATYTVSDGLGDVDVDQTLPVEDDTKVYDVFNDEDKNFQLIGNVVEDGDGIITIVLFNDGANFFIADAVAIESLLVFDISPDNGAENIDINADLSWQLATPVTSLDVYFSEDPNFAGTTPVIEDELVTSYEPGTLAFDTTYYWKVDVTVDGSLVEGDVWSFTTAPAIPVVTTQPLSQTVEAGSDVTFVIEQLNGTSYQWSKDGVEITGATSDTYEIASAQISDEGAYTCKVFNTAGDAVSDEAGLWIKRLVAHWDFDGDMIDNVDGWEGVYTDPNNVGGVYDTESISGQSLKLEGDEQHAQVAGSEGYFNFFPNGYTVSAWINSDFTSNWQAAVSKHNRTIYDETVEVDAGWAIYTNGNTGVATLRQAGDITGTSSVVDGGWHLLVNQYDPVSDTVKIYVDGVLQNESGPVPDILVNDAPLVFGADSPSGTWAWNGLIDEVKIWNYAVDSYEIAHSYTDVMTDETICVEQTGIMYDLNDDCRVDLADFAIFASEWLNCNSVPDCK